MKKLKILACKILKFFYSLLNELLKQRDIMSFEHIIHECVLIIIGDNRDSIRAVRNREYMRH